MSITIDYKNRKNITFYKNDLKYKKHRELDVEDLKYNDDEFDQLMIEDMDTIKYRLMDCEKSGGTSLDLSHLELRECPNNLLKNIRFLFCSNNELQKIEDLSYLANLEVFDCCSNKLEILPKLPLSIIEVNCKDNLIQDISNIRDCKQLSRIDCSFNKISRIPSFEKIDILVCSNNQIETIENMNSLRKLHCKNNKIEHLDSFENLLELDIDKNRLKRISDLPRLKFLYCNDNKITDFKNLNNLVSIQLYNNPIDNIPYFDGLKEMVCKYSPDKNINKKYMNRIKHFQLMKDDVLYMSFD